MINEAVIAKVPLRLLAKTYGMSIAALSRHNKNHVSHATFEQRAEVMLDRLLAKCAELEVQALETAEDAGGEASDEVIGAIDDLRQEVLVVKNSSRLWLI